MFEEPVDMVTTESHQSQDLVVPTLDQDQVGQLEQLEQQEDGEGGFSPGTVAQGPVNAITVLTLLDKLVNMLDGVQENQSRMERHQVEMEGVVRGIQADMTKLSKNHSTTSNTVSKLLDKSRKLSVTMKEVREKMERQGAQVKKLEANHAHLVSRNNFRVLIFQEENEIPASVYVKDPPPFPRDEILEEGEESAPGTDASQVQEGELHTIQLSSDEDVGLEAELEEDDIPLQDLENMEKSRAEKLKLSSLKKVDSLKKAFSRQNIEKKMTKIGTKIVSQEQREKIKQKTSSLKVSPVTFSFRKPRSSSDSRPADESLQADDVEQQSPDLNVSFTEVHAELAPEGSREEGIREVVEVEVEAELEEEREVEERGAEEASAVEQDLSLVSEGVSEEYALSATVLHEEQSGDGEEEEVKPGEVEEVEEVMEGERSDLKEFLPQ